MSSFRNAEKGYSIYTIKTIIIDIIIAAKIDRRVCSHGRRIQRAAARISGASAGISPYWRLCGWKSGGREGAIGLALQLGIKAMLAFMHDARYAYAALHRQSESASRCRD